MSYRDHSRYKSYSYTRRWGQKDSCRSPKTYNGGGRGSGRKDRILPSQYSIPRYGDPTPSSFYLDLITELPLCDILRSKVLSVTLCRCLSSLIRSIDVELERGRGVPGILSDTMDAIIEVSCLGSQKRS